MQALLESLQLPAETTVHLLDEGSLQFPVGTAIQLLLASRH